MEQTRFLAVCNKIIFPGCAGEIEVSASDADIVKGSDIVVLSSRNVLLKFLRVIRVATLCEISADRLSDGKRVLELKGKIQVRVSRFSRNTVVYYPFEVFSGPRVPDLSIKLRKRAQEFIFLVDTSESERLIYLMNFINDPAELADFVANYFIFDYSMRWKIFKCQDVYRRISLILSSLDKLIDEVKKRKMK